MKAVALQKKDSQTNKASTLKKSAAFFGPSVIQKKLSIGASDDAYEVEADRMADQVIGMSDVNVQSISKGALVQRKCTACEEDHLQKKPLAKYITPLIQKKQNTSVNRSVASDHVSSRINSNKGAGSKMDTNTKSFMESRFGADFSNVRVHTDTNAKQLSKKLNAQAFTVGNDIYFNDGKYNPVSRSGKHLLAHELTHTIQQKGIQRNEIQKKEEEDPCNYRSRNINTREIHLNLGKNAIRVYSGTTSSFSVAAEYNNIITGPDTRALARENGWCHLY